MAFGIHSLAGSVQGAEQLLPAPDSTHWTNGIGGGFQPGAQTFSFEAAGTYGWKILGSSQSHDLALASLSYGHMLGPVMGGDGWYRGNWEWRAELFGGSQFSPSAYWIVGLTPHLRYNFATGTRWIPFADAGMGLTATGIGPLDLGSTFEFNLQGGAGAHWFVRDNWAVTLEVDYFHLSDAGITHSNNGVNATMGKIGLTWFF